MFKSLIILALLIFGSESALAQIEGLADYYTQSLRGTQARIASNNLNKTKTPKTCPAQLYNITQDNELDIFVAFGYMNASDPKEFVDSATNDYLYQLGDVLDIDSREAFERILTSSCTQNKAKFFACGFSQNGVVFSKKINNKFTGKKMQVNVTVMAPAVTSKDSANRKSAAQKTSTAQVKGYFENALQTADAVIYMGHARSGAGPDFGPKGASKGSIGTIVATLAATPTPAPVLGILACRGTALFQNKLAGAAPNSIIVTAGELFDYNDVVPTGLAMVEGLVSQQCQDGFKNIVKVQPASANYVNVLF